jgi:phosphoribosylamine--glycine ligase
VLCVTALGDSVRQAQAKAYQIAQHIYFEGSQMRHDIGWRAVKP